VSSSAPDDDTIAITVNGAARHVGARGSVAALLVELGLGGRRVAVAVNREIVPRSTYATRALAAGDRIEILEAVGGG
jgi:sulfur carrier protein